LLVHRPYCQAPCVQFGWHSRRCSGFHWSSDELGINWWSQTGD